MAYTIAAILTCTLLFACLQVWMIRKLHNHYSRSLAPWPDDRPWPKAAIIVSLRGSDPFLETCLRNLLKQDYPDFFLQIIIDSETDPAWEAIRIIQNERDDAKLFVSILHERRSSCSLKNSSIIQALTGLSIDREVVAFVDADAVTHATWLRDLVAPLADPDVGCSTGVRWFAPSNHTFGTKLRCFWNLFAAPVIFQSNTPWGGSMVVRRSVLDSGLSEEWSRMFCEDVHTTNHLRSRGLKLVCVPQATVPNSETTSVFGCVKFANRQMLIFRLYHRHWRFVVASILGGACLRLTHDFFIVRSLVCGEWLLGFGLVAIRQIGFQVIKTEAIRLDRVVRKSVENTGRDIIKNPIPEFSTFLLVEALFFTSMVYALGTRYANWRGVTYRINGARNVKMLAYRTYRETTDVKETHSTIV